MSNSIPLLQNFDAKGVATIQNVRDPVEDGDIANLRSVKENSSLLEVIASGAISGGRAIAVKNGLFATYPDLADPVSADYIAGVSLNAAADGETVNIKQQGQITDPAWNWNLGAVFSGDNGILTQSVPAGAWIRQVGVAVSSTIIVVDLRPVILTP